MLYFYPKDNTSGCTTEALEFSELAKQFEGMNAVIAGVSPDSIKSHINFKEKQNLNVLLLSDPQKETANAYGAYGEKKMYGKSYMGVIRSTFIIKNGIIEKMWVKVTPKGHANEVLCSLK